MKDKKNNKKSVLIYDDSCGMCTGAAKFIKDRDKHNIFEIIGMNTQKGRELRKKYLKKETDSLVLIDNHRVFIKSDAVFHAAADMPFPWKMLTIFRIFPRFAGNFIYDIIAENRKNLQIFKKSGSDS